MHRCSSPLQQPAPHSAAMDVDGGDAVDGGATDNALDGGQTTAAAMSVTEVPAKKKGKNRYGSSRRRGTKNSTGNSRNTHDVLKSEETGLTMGQLQSRKYLEKLLLRLMMLLKRL